MAEGSSTTVDLLPLLTSENRDFIVRNDDTKVDIGSLTGKTVGLYFSASWCPPCRGFTPSLSEVYQDLSSSKKDFEVIFVSSDRDEESFNGYFSKMPWLAVPFSDTSGIKRLKEHFEVRGIPFLVVIDGAGNVLNTQGVRLVKEYGVAAFPFTPERIEQLKKEDELAKTNQTLRSVLAYGTRDYVISNDCKKIPISNLEGQMVALYFAVSSSFEPSAEFTEKLVDVYNKIREKGESLEIVMIYLGDDAEDFNETLKKTPFHALPFEDKACEKLPKYFELRDIPWLVIIGHDGKTLNPNAAELIEEHGADAYPFTPEKVAELAAIEKARLESQTLETLFGSGEENALLGKNGQKVQISELVGKHVLIYFSAHWCPPCRAFTPKLVEAYNDIKGKESNFEIIFVSSDRDDAAFEEYYSSMPWLALPFGDKRKTFLSRRFKVDGIPTLVAVGPSGRTVTTEARELVMEHGAEAFPFTDERISELEQKKNNEADVAVAGPPEGYVCDGDVCRKA